jgi:drug/metabolite transporter (DMT)-like permease
VALSLGGCLLVSGALQSSAWQANFIGILTGILAGLFYAIYSLFGRSASQRGMNTWTTLLYTFAALLFSCWHSIYFPMERSPVPSLNRVTFSV